jgi:tRNA1Val (adenine37-N6)-methyltransferase
MSVEFTKDAFLDGRVHVFQPVKGFRAGTDSVLLAAALDGGFSGQALEVGCGAGGALLPAATRLSAASFTGLECDPEMVSLAEKGVVENALQSRVDIIQGDAASLPKHWQNKFDLVFSNPPFFEPGKITEPGVGKEAAYLESLSLKGWINAMLFALRPKGQLVMIHRAAELARILANIERQTGDISILPIQNYPGASAKRVIVSARKGLRSGPVKLLAPFSLHGSKGGAATPDLQNIAREGSGIQFEDYS